MSRDLNELSTLCHVMTFAPYSKGTLPCVRDSAGTGDKQIRYVPSRTPKMTTAQRKEFTNLRPGTSRKTHFLNVIALSFRVSLLISFF